TFRIGVSLRVSAQRHLRDPTSISESTKPFDNSNDKPQAWCQFDSFRLSRRWTSIGSGSEDTKKPG
ncbi:hypothetical protein HDU67_001952, partial [Dinochytrium kinnereticum]